MPGRGADAWQGLTLEFQPTELHAVLPATDEWVPMAIRMDAATARMRRTTIDTCKNFFMFTSG
jgi:hypothetical protein